MLEGLGMALGGMSQPWITVDVFEGYGFRIDLSSWLCADGVDPVSSHLTFHIMRTPLLAPLGLFWAALVILFKNGYLCNSAALTLILHHCAACKCAYSEVFKHVSGVKKRKTGN